MITDFIHEFKACNGVPSKCRIRIYEGMGFERGMKLVLCSQLINDDEAGMSVTNAAEQIATEVASLHKIDPTRLIWIEHYPKRGVRAEIKESFDRVTFTTTICTYPVRWQFQHAQWVHRISRAEIVVATGEQP